jgi:uncharacterized membrane protein YphA (DoxX/SURF4 family)
MQWLDQIRSRSAAEDARWLIILRIGLGVALCLKGISFVRDSSVLEKIVFSYFPEKYFAWLVPFISWSHMFCGFMIVIGLLTRWAVLIQIPILLGAVIIVTMGRQVPMGSSEFILSFIILILLIVFEIIGGGPLSLDEYWKRNP